MREIKPHDLRLFSFGKGFYKAAGSKQRIYGFLATLCRINLPMSECFPGIFMVRKEIPMSSLLEKVELNVKI